MKNLLSIFVIVILVISCKKEKSLEEGKYRINVTVKGLDNGEVYLMNYPNIDTLKVEGGSFSIEKELKDVVGQVSLTKEPKNRRYNPKSTLSIFVEPTIMALDLEYEDFSKSKLTGSKTQDDQYRLDGLTEKVALKYKDEHDSYKKIRKNFDKNFQTATKEEKERLKDAEYGAKGKLAPMYKETNDVVLNFIKNSPDSYISVRRLLFAMRGLKYGEAKPLVEAIPDELLNTADGKQVVKRLEDMQKGVPGVIAGNFETIDINGNPIKLNDFKGKYLLIDFWASWCVPCRKGNPHLISLYKKYNPKGLEILGVSDDDGAHDKWRKAVKKDQIGIWHHVLRGVKYVNGRVDFNDKSTDISEGYNISSLPTKVLVGPDGVIIGRYGSGGGNDDDMDRDLARLFEN